ncbi:MAG: PHB depolymerase family esterase [Bacteroidota bacterium]
MKAQTETCLHNANHPNLRILSQETVTETIFREYIIYIPQNYEENIPTPLVINMHGFGDCASDYAETIGSFYNFNDLADQENFIVAYPQGAYRPEKEDTYWEPGDSGTENIYENDVYFLEELVSHISSEFNLDMDMIFACGYSNGGMMAYSLACNRSNLFTAIGIMSGTMLPEECSPNRSVPMIIFHGIADEVLPYEGSFWYQSVDEVVNFWLDKNEISPENLVSSTLNAGNVVLDEYKDGSSCISLYTINKEFDKPGGHVWFSENIEGENPNSILWDFFTSNCESVSASIDPNQKEHLVFPNPFLEILTIANSANKEYSLYDINGKVIQNGTLRSNSVLLDFSNELDGIYFLKIGEQIIKLLKSN